MDETCENGSELVSKLNVTFLLITLYQKIFDSGVYEELCSSACPFSRFARNTIFCFVKDRWQKKQTTVVDKCLLKVNIEGSKLVPMEILLMSLLQQWH